LFVEEDTFVETARVSTYNTSAFEEMTKIKTKAKTTK
jgi:hypothetical protein